MTRHGVLTTVGVRSASVLMAAANLIVIARVFGPSGRGTLAVVEALVGLVVICAGQWLSSLSSVRAAGDPAQVPRLLTLNAWWSAAVGSLCAVGITFGHPLLRTLGFDGLHHDQLVAAMVGLPAQLFNTAALGLTLGFGRLKAFNVLTVVMSNAYLPALAVVAAAGQLDLWALLVAHTVVQYVVAGGILLYYHRTANARPTWRLRADDVSANLRFGSKLALTGIAAFITMRASVLLLDVFSTEAQVGLYAVATRVGDLIMLLPNTVCAIILARLSQIRDPLERHRETMRFARILTAIVAALALGAASTGRILIPLVFGDAYAPSYEPLLVLLPGLVFLTLELVLAQHLAAIGVPRAMVLLWLVVATVSIGLNLVLIPALGILGVALTTTLTYGLLALGVVTIYRRVVSMRA